MGRAVGIAQLAFPARHHAYFIRTFLLYYKHTGEKEWLVRARDLADWNLAHSTPADAVYANIPYSAYVDGKPTGSADKNSTEPDKAAFIGSAYIALYEATSEKKYLDAAKAIAETLVKRQNKDGSWPFRVIPGDGKVYQEFGGAPVFYVEFFENILRHETKASYQDAHDRALKLMLERNVEKDLWGIYHEDVAQKTREQVLRRADVLHRRLPVPPCEGASRVRRDGPPHPRQAGGATGAYRRPSRRTRARGLRAGGVRAHDARPHRAVLPGAGRSLHGHR